MKRIILFVLVFSLAACNPSYRYGEWKRSMANAETTWEECVFNSTLNMTGEYTDTAFIAGLSIHACEPFKEEFISVQLQHPGAQPSEKVRDHVNKYEERLRDKMQVLATKWLIDENAKLNAQFPVEMEFR